MIDTLGLPLAWAEKLLSDAGYSVRTLEVRSRKGVEGGDARVLRQKVAGDGAAELTYAYCITKPKA